MSNLGDLMTNQIYFENLMRYLLSVFQSDIDTHTFRTAESLGDLIKSGKRTDAFYMNMLHASGINIPSNLLNFLDVAALMRDLADTIEMSSSSERVKLEYGINNEMVFKFKLKDFVVYAAQIEIEDDSYDSYDSYSDNVSYREIKLLKPVSHYEPID